MSFWPERAQNLRKALALEMKKGLRDKEVEQEKEGEGGRQWREQKSKIKKEAHRGI